MTGNPPPPVAGTGEMAFVMPTTIAVTIDTLADFVSEPAIRRMAVLAAKSHDGDPEAAIMTLLRLGMAYALDDDGADGAQMCLQAIAVIFQVMAKLLDGTNVANMPMTDEMAEALVRLATEVG